MLPSRSPATIAGRVWRAASVALVLITAVACDDVPTEPRVEAALASAYDSPTLLDGAIDQTDTYLLTRSITTVTQTVTSATPFFDPVRGQYVTSVTFPAIVDTVRSEAGYDAYGNVRLNEYNFGGDRATDAVRLQIADGIVRFYDAAGRQVYDTSGIRLLDAIGTMNDVVVTDNSVFHDDPTSADPLEPDPGDPDSELLTVPRTARPMTAAAPRRRVVRRGDRLEITTILDDPSSGRKGTRTIAYRRRGALWVIDGERESVERTADGLVTRRTEVTEYPVVRWNTNAARDAARRKRRRAQSAGTVATPARLSPAVPAAIALAVGLPAAPSPLVVAPEDCIDCDPNATPDDGGYTTTSSGINLALQHGLLGSAASWSRMDPWLAQRYTLGAKVVPTLDAKQGIESQAVTLTNLLLDTRAANFLIVGHSNGGLVARRVAQNSSGVAGSLVGGVVAIASPHQGVPLAHNSRQIVSDLLTRQFQDVLGRIAESCWRRQFDWICSWLQESTRDFIPRVVNFAFDEVAPVSRDVVPGSSFLGSLNGRTEGFRRYSVEVRSDGSWKFIRLLGDWRCEPEHWCSGSRLQNGMEAVYAVLRYCGSNFLARLVASGLAEKCRDVRWALSRTNQFYERLTAPGDQSDGIVPAQSQAYPGIRQEDREIMDRAEESHAGELKSTNVRDRLFRVVDRHRAVT